MGLSQEDRIVIQEKAKLKIRDGTYLEQNLLLDEDIDYVYPLLKSYDERLRIFSESFASRQKGEEILKQRVENLIKENSSLRSKLAEKTLSGPEEQDGSVAHL